MQSAGRRLRSLSDSSSVREISKLARGSNTWFRGRSFAASVPSDAPKVKRNQKRLPKDERRALVETSVNNYRGRNMGKFPTTCYVRKEVGGSYYIVKELLQELEYKSKLSSSNTGEASSRTEVTRDNEASSESQMIFSNQKIVDADILKDDQTVTIIGVETNDSNFMRLEVEKGTNVSVAVDNILSEEVAKPIEAGDDSKYVVTKNHMLLEEIEEVPNSYPMGAKNFEEEALCESMLDINGSKSKSVEKQPLPESIWSKKTEDVKEETPYETFLNDGSESKLVEHQPLSEYPYPRKPEDVKEERFCESALNDDKESKAEEHQPLSELKKFVSSQSRVSNKNQREEKTRRKSSIWQNLKSVAEGIINIWRKP